MAGEYFMTFKGICLSLVCALSMSVSALASTVHVEGTASFELRYTIAPRVIILGGSVPQSKPYWVVVVKSPDGDTYEIDKQFSLGENDKPSKIILLNKAIQENSGISLDGTISSQSGNYVWLDQVTNVRSFNIDYQVILTPLPSDPFINWTCQGQMDANTEVFADVWFEANSATHTAAGSYVVSLSTAALQGDNRQFTPLAYLDGGRIRVEDRATIFDATTTQDSVTLEIENSDAVANVPGTMTFSVHESPRDLGVSTSKSVDGLQVTCNRNR
jgi:hypothetical protein